MAMDDEDWRDLERRIDDAVREPDDEPDPDVEDDDSEVEGEWQPGLKPNGSARRRREDQYLSEDERPGQGGWLNSMRLLIIILLSLLTLSSPSLADSLWTYQGNDPLSGTVLLNSQDQVVAWNFTDGPDRLNKGNSTATIYPHFDGVIVPSLDIPFATWYLIIQGRGGVEFISYFSGSPSDNVDYATGRGAFYEQGNPGVWSDPPVSTPEPGTIWLVGVGLAWLVLRRVRIHL